MKYELFQYVLPHDGDLSDLNGFLSSHRVVAVTQSVGHHGQFNRCDLGVPWLGFTVYPNRVRLNAVGRKRVRNRMKSMEKRFDCGMMSEAELQQRVSSMFAHAQFADDIRWRRGICSDIMQWESQEPRAAWRVVRQHGDQVPHGVSQQEQGR